MFNWGGIGEFRNTETKEDDMSATRRFLVVGADGRLSLPTPVSSVLDGFGSLLAIGAPRPEVATLDTAEPTRLGFQRTGDAIRGAMKLHRERRQA